MSVHGIYISKPQSGVYYIAERPDCGGRRYLWSVMADDLNTVNVRIGASEVPLAIRRAAYRWLGEQDEATTRRSPAGQGMAWRGAAGPGEAWHGMELYSRASAG